MPDAGVIAWLPRLHPSLEELAGGGGDALDSSALASAQSDSDGRFVLGGLDPDAVYHVCAGARGLAAAELERNIPPGREDLLLVLHPIVGLQVRLIERGAIEPQGGRFWEAPDQEWRWPAGGTWVERDDPRLILAGVPPELCVRRRSLSAGLFFLVEDDSHPFGPIAFEARIPGYLPVSEELFAHPLRNGLFVHDIPLSAVSAAWGSLEVSLLLAPAHASVAPVAWPELGRLVLQDSHDPARRYFHVVQSLDRDPIQFQRLPAGDYRLQFVPAHRFARLHDSIDASVHDGRTTRAVIDLASSLELEVEVFSSDGAWYLGTVLAEIASTHTGGVGSSFFLFQRPPYILQGLPSGEYTVTLNEPFFAERWVSLPASLEERAKVSFRPR